MSPAGPGGGSLGFRHKRVQRLRRLQAQASYRRSEGAFVVEGAKLVTEALRAGAVESVYVAPAGDNDPTVAEARAGGVRVFRLGPGVLERATSTVSPQPVLAVATTIDRPLEAVTHHGWVVVCVDVRDPGNLGTVVRTAEASGVGAIVCTDGTVDVYNPKCVRASAGAMFHVPLVVGGEPLDVLQQLGARGLRRLGAASGAGTPYHQVDFRPPTALVLGNEAHGLRDLGADSVDGWVTVPMVGRAESLNVGMAAAVLCFEAARQRKQ